MNIGTESTPKNRFLPAREVLSAFGLGDRSRMVPTVTDRQELSTADGITYIMETIVLPQERLVHPETGLPSGYEILRSELAMTDSFNLLIREDRLIAVIPDIDPATYPGRWPHYLDATDLHFSFPLPGAVGIEGLWSDFFAAWNLDNAVIEDNFARRGINNYGKDKIYQLGGDIRNVGVVSINKETGQTYADRHSVSELEKFQRSFEDVLSQDSGQYKIVFPVIPTVYDSFKEWREVIPYLYAWHKSYSSDSARTLIVGPGHGVDVWTASLNSSLPVSCVGLNPLEVASAKIIASIAGFEINAKVGDNIISPEGVPAFSEQFDLSYWNMPNYALKAAPKEKFRHLWDEDVDGVVLSRYSRSLPIIMNPSSRALIWNTCELGREIIGIIKQDNPGSSVVMKPLVSNKGAMFYIDNIYGGVSAL